MEKKKSIIVVSVIAILAIATVASVAILSNDDSNDETSGLTGMYIYVARGTYEVEPMGYTTIMGYTGSWELTLDNGSVVDNEYSLNTTTNTSYTNVDLGTTQPVPDHPDGYVDPIPEMNELLDGAEYIGYLVIETTYYGSVGTSVYKIDDKTYYADDSGIVYRMVVVNDKFTDTEIQVVYELISIAD
ncbi:MAG: hypothetical protein KRP56_03655 [Candidatus Methanogranum gryphiswaldense]|nr:MAG: hypothetical protein KRP56_03655 [Candidatus Methanogranum sp. U3.2.1]